MNVRLATAADASKWIDLFRSTFGEQYPARIVYDVNWVAQQLAPPAGHETWVAENAGRLESAVSFLTPSTETNSSPIINMGRNLHRSESLVNGGSAALLDAVNQVATQRGQTIITRIQAQGNSQQILYENAGYVCAGLQPLKHQGQSRFSALFYVRPIPNRMRNECAIQAQALAGIADLAKITRERLRLHAPQIFGNDVTGYPLQNDISIAAATQEDYLASFQQACNANPPVEISGSYNWGVGPLRIPTAEPAWAFLAVKEGRAIGGLLLRMDELDQCARIVGGFATDGVSMGGLLSQALRTVENSSGVLYTEVDILVTAPRLLKTAEQLGFVPVAYLPGFGWRADGCVDVVKAIKLNTPYSPQANDLTEHAQAIVDLVNASFEDQRMGLATARLLRPLAMFQGLGDGDLRKISRLFTQKLYRAGERIFDKGDSGREAYIVLRGQIDILLEPESKPVASLSNGKIFGELAFLDGCARSTFAVAAQPSILQVVQQSAFLDLARKEPALGMIVMRNLALDLAAKLRNADLAILNLSETSRS